MRSAFPPYETFEPYELDGGRGAALIAAMGEVGREEP